MIEHKKEIEKKRLEILSDINIYYTPEEIDNLLYEFKQTLDSKDN